MIGILSDGLPGPGRAAIRAATLAGLPTKTGDPMDDARVAHATLLFVSTRVEDRSDCDEVARACGANKKPMMTIHVWSQPDSVPVTSQLAGLIRAKGFRTINIAGSRGSGDPGEPGKPWSGIEGWCESYLFDLFTLLKEEAG